MAKVKIISPVRHDGVSYGVGTEVTVKKLKDADRLVKLGVAETLDAGDEEPAVDDTNEKDDEEPAVDDTNEKDDAVDYETLKVNELKELLDKKGTKYAANANKAELIALLQE